MPLPPGSTLANFYYLVQRFCIDLAMNKVENRKTTFPCIISLIKEPYYYLRASVQVIKACRGLPDHGQMRGHFGFTLAYPTPSYTKF